MTKNTVLNYGVFYTLIIMISCSTNKSSEQMTFDIEGHRGCRGLYPENTIPAFKKALELGVSTLEMDLVISKDKKVVVSHEPFFRSGLSLTPEGDTISKEDQLSHNIYNMLYDEVRSYDVGSIPDPKHPHRVNISVSKPLFEEVIKMTKSYCEKHGKSMPDFNIEIKRHPDYDHKFHPDAEEFVQLVLNEVDRLDIFQHTIIQSFDLESLQLTKEKAPSIRTALLIENEKSPIENLNALGFIPDIYSSYFELVDDELINLCRKKGILVIPWTVNTEEDINNMLKIGVDGIISDYPDRLIKLYNQHANN